MRHSLAAISAIAITALVPGCAGTAAPDGPTVQFTVSSVQGVTFTAVDAGRTQFGDSIVVQIRNAGSATVYLSQCGNGPLILLQQFVNGQWTGGVQNFACPLSTVPGPIQLSSGASTTSVRYLSAGRYRFLAIADTVSDLRSAVRIASTAVDVP